MYERDKMVDLLHRGHYCRVNFIKADGSNREMRATLNVASMPLTEIHENNKPSTYSKEVVRVWDIDKGAWRSFRVDSVVTFDMVQ